MTDRQFGFLLKMASEGRGDSHFVVKLATSPRMRREMGSMRPAGTSATPTTAKPTAAAPARSAAAPAAAAPARPVAAPAASTATPAPTASTAPAPYDPKRYGDLGYFNDRYKMYKDIATKYEANATAGKEKKKEEFNPGNVTHGEGFKPNRSNSLLDRMNALRAERERQAAGSGASGSALYSTDESVAREAWNRRFPNGVPGQNPDVFSNGQASAQPAGEAAAGAAGAAGAAVRRGYTPTPQMSRMTEEFDRLPQQRQLSLLRSAGVDLQKYMRASPKQRDSMIMSAYEYARNAREQAAARRNAWRNTPGFRNGVRVRNYSSDTART